MTLVTEKPASTSAGLSRQVLCLGQSCWWMGPLDRNSLQSPWEARLLPRCCLLFSVFEQDFLGLPDEAVYDMHRPFPGRILIPQAWPVFHCVRLGEELAPRG